MLYKFNTSSSYTFFFKYGKIIRKCRIEFSIHTSSVFIVTHTQGVQFHIHNDLRVSLKNVHSFMVKPTSENQNLWVHNTTTTFTFNYLGGNNAAKRHQLITNFASHRRLNSDGIFSFYLIDYEHLYFCPCLSKRTLRCDVNLRYIKGASYLWQAFVFCKYIGCVR